MLWAIGTRTGENKGTAKLASCDINRKICQFQMIHICFQRQTRICRVQLVCYQKKRIEDEKHKRKGWDLILTMSNHVRKLVKEGNEKIVSTCHF